MDSHSALDSLSASKLSITSLAILARYLLLPESQRYPHTILQYLPKLPFLPILEKSTVTPPSTGSTSKVAFSVIGSRSGIGMTLPICFPCGYHVHKDYVLLPSNLYPNLSEYKYNILYSLFRHVQVCIKACYNLD